jgi:hypothetical protein
MSAALRYLALVLLLWTATLATAGESLTGAQLAEQAVEKTATAHDQLNKTLLEEKEWRKDFNKRSWEWHLLSTKIIFTMVVGTVLFGLFLSYLQFTREERILRRRAKRPAATTSEKETPPASTGSSIKISATGLELSSQVIGMLILGFSLAFFYLYVENIYPINEGGRKILAEPAQSELDGGAKAAPEATAALNGSTH